VHGSNAARFEQSFRVIADQVKIPNRTNPKANIFKLVHDWLCDERKGRWVLILDNVDNVDFLFTPQTTSLAAQEGGLNSDSAQPLFLYLPPSAAGLILITTRSRDMALKMVEEGNIITVEPMDKVQALALCKKKLGIQGNKSAIAELATALEFMPLAIVQAAAYVKERAPRCSVRQYIEKLRKGDKAKTSLLNYDGGYLRRDWEAKNSIIITWQISFDYIFRTRRSAADLLSLMSLFDRQGIPEALLRNQDETRNRYESSGAGGGNNEESDGDSSALDASVDDGFEDDILALRNYSFISLTTDATTFEMHGLVQLATRKWLEGQGQLEGWKKKYITNLCREFPTGKYENWTKCRALFPHAKSALAQPPEGEESLKEWALLLYNAAWYAWQQGSTADAEKMSVKSMKVREKLLGKDQEKTLSSMAMVGLAYNLQGRWKEAEELYMQVMETRKRVLREEHPDTLASMANLASTYRNQGRWKEAEELDVQVMGVRKRVLREEHPDTLASINNLASTFWSQGRWKEAEELYMQVMETRKRVLGEEHPDTLTSIGNLASTYWNQGRWKEAEELEVQVTETRKRVLKEEHPNTLTSIANLASTFWSQGRWKEAEELDVQVMETSVRVLGEEHPDTLTRMANLAYTFKRQGRKDEAISLMEKCLRLRKQVLSPQHPYTKTSLRALKKWQMENIEIW
jgi:tetratricopeptide (TPR) repeat protein